MGDEGQPYIIVILPILRSCDPDWALMTSTAHLAAMTCCRDVFRYGRNSRFWLLQVRGDLAGIIKGHGPKKSTQRVHLRSFLVPLSCNFKKDIGEVFRPFLKRSLPVVKHLCLVHHDRTSHHRGLYLGPLSTLTYFEASYEGWQEHLKKVKLSILLSDLIIVQSSHLKHSHYFLAKSRKKWT